MAGRAQKPPTWPAATPLALALCLVAQDPRESALPAVPLGLEPLQRSLQVLPQAGSIALGRRLFFDPVLSVDRTIACASCHDPAHGFADDSAVSSGVRDRRTTRNAPTLYNRAFGRSFMWDGRAASLEDQVLLPIANERELAFTVEAAVERLASDPAYVAGFREAFGTDPTEEHLSQALAAYVRSLLYGDSPVDRFRDGDYGALSAAEREGMWFFESRGGCWRCHSGPNFTDEDFHNTGVGARDGEPEQGRFAITGRPGDIGRFKTPTLRGLLETPPYMHDGSLASLEEVADFYRRGGGPNPDLDPLLRPLEMTDQDAANLVAFLGALSRRPAGESSGSPPGDR